MPTLSNYQTGALTNQTVCPIQTAIVPQVPGSQVANQPELLAVAYHVTAGTGVTAGTVTFQELGADGVWRNLSSPTPLSLTAAGDSNGNFTGPFHGVRISLGSITGGTVSFAELQAALAQ